MTEWRKKPWEKPGSVGGALCAAKSSQIVQRTHLVPVVLSRWLNLINDMGFINVILNIMHFCVYFIALKKRVLVIFCSMRPLVASGEKTKAPPQLKYCLLKTKKYKTRISFSSHFDSPSVKTVLLLP